MTVVFAVPLVTFPQIGEASGHRVPPGQEARLVPGAQLPVRVEPVSGKVPAVDWHVGVPEVD